MLTFRQAPEVQVGDRPTSEQMSGLAHAFNDRLLSGVADWGWRLAYYLIGIWRQVRNPASDGFVFPSQLEWFTHYGHANPDRTTSVWPDAEDGTAEGANLANVMMAGVFGNPSVESEPERFLDVPLWTGETAPTLRNLWDIGAQQRGARDPSNGVQGSPAADAAQSWQRIMQPTWSPHGKAYGGLLPTPERGTTGATEPGECGDTDEDGLYVVSYKIKFSALRESVDAPDPHHGTETTVGGKSVVTYDGSCPCGTAENAIGHVLGIWSGPQAYFVAVRTGANCLTDYAIVRYAYEDWIEGPYDGEGYPAHTDGSGLNRMMHAFASDYRGSYEQRAGDDYRIKRIAFPMQEFLGRQYQLAPALGDAYIDGGNWVIDALYPKASYGEVASIPANTLATFESTETEHECTTGHVAAGWLVEASKLVGSTTLSAYDGETHLGSVALTADESGNASAMLWPESPVTAAALKFRCSGATFSAADGQLKIEVAELLEQKPQYWDAMLVQRLSAAGNGRQVDGRGVDHTENREFGERLLRYGCIQGDWPAGPDEHEVNTNPVYDVARRFTNKLLRIIHRQQFIAYEVADGKSILYLSRWANGNSTDHLDMLEGIAPPVEAVGGEGVTEGETYVVRSDGGAGTVTYSSTVYTVGQTFTATSVREFTASGDAMVHVYDGIRTVALKRGWTNRWASFVETKHYHWSNSSIWKPDAYSDYWPLSDRCHVYSGSFPRQLRALMTYNYSVDVDDDTGAITRYDPRAQATLFAPEGPTGYRYLYGANVSTYNTLMRSSCRVYEPPVELESAIVTDHEAGIVKLTFSGRFHSHPDAPATWSATPPLWDGIAAKPAAIVQLEEETDPDEDGYRTADNALRSYHVYNANRTSGYESTWNPALAVGDYGADSTLPTLTGKPYGAVFPTLFLFALVNEPHADGTYLQKTRMTVDEMQKCELLLRAGCHGWLDSEVSKEIVCARNPIGVKNNEGHMFDFTWEALNFQAHGGRWIGSVGEELRPENPEGYGPLPNTRIYADVFNRTVAVVNMLTRARIPIPTEVQFNLSVFSGEESRTFTSGSGCRYLLNATAPAANDVSDDHNPAFGWVPVYGIGAWSYLGWAPQQWARPITSPEDGLRSGRHEIKIRVVPVEGFENCIPPALLEHLQTGYGGVIAHHRTISEWHESGADCDDQTGGQSITDHGCEVFTMGTYNADPPPTSDYLILGGTQTDAGTYDQYMLMLANQSFVEIPTV